MASTHTPVIECRVDGYGGFSVSSGLEVTAEVERSFKEVLYRFLEEVSCTKAALYLSAPDGSADVIVQYGFGRGNAPPEELPADDPVAAAVSDLGGVPLVVNQTSDIPALERRLLAAGAQRVLLVPLMRGEDVVGFVDARDKAGDQMFTDIDCGTASRIAADLVRVFEALRPASEPEPAMPEEPAAQSAAEVLEEPLPGVIPRSESTLLDQPAVARLADSALEVVVRDRVWAVALTVAADDSAATVLISAAEVDAMEGRAVMAHQADALSDVGAAVPPAAGWSLEGRRVPTVAPPPRASLIVTTVPLSDEGWSLVMSVVGAEGSSDPALVLDRLVRQLATVHEMSVLRFVRRSLARRLLEPGEARFPDLQHHCMAVSRLCWSMALDLGLDTEQVEDAVITGLLHDVGMRELDYDRLYRLDQAGPEHQRVYRKHVVVGERIVRGVGMDDVADAIRHHHERWDGAGYPDRLAGEEIPWLARLVHTAEVFDVLTSESSYRPQVPPDRALTTMESAAGRQFDPEMVATLIRVVS